MLEGPLGAGKTTFARALIQALGVVAAAGREPDLRDRARVTVARASVVHIDFYRLRSEAEIDEAGIPAYFWERPDAIVLASGFRPGRSLRRRSARRALLEGRARDRR